VPSDGEIVVTGASLRRGGQLPANHEAARLK
jgi:hypothetical protein